MSFRNWTRDLYHSKPTPDHLGEKTDNVKEFAEVGTFWIKNKVWRRGGSVGSSTECEPKQVKSGRALLRLDPDKEKNFGTAVYYWK